MKSILLLTATSLLLPMGVNAETLQSAKVTTRINDVRLYQPKKSARQANLVIPSKDTPPFKQDAGHERN